MDDHFYDEEDLVTANPSDRNWKGIIIAVLVITTVLALIVTSVVLLTPPDEGPRVKGKRFDLEEIFRSEFQAYRTNGSWVSDHEWIYRDTSGGASILNVTDGSVRTLITNYTLRRFDAKLSGVSPNLKYVILVYDVKQIHRYSTASKYMIYHVETGDYKHLNVPGSRGGGENWDKDEEGYTDLQLVKWSPADNSLAFVHEGDIYYKPSPSNGTHYRLTNSAIPGVIYNGVPDWLYEEEILESNSALWFSNDGRNLLYLTFNDSLVGEHPILQYGSFDEPYIYPQMKTLRYPKPGTNNPIVTAKVVELRQSRAFRVQEMYPPRGIAEVEHYVTSCGWANNKEVAVIWTTRSYNLSIISICNAANGTCEEEYRITTEKRGWLDTIPFPYFTSKPNSRNFITIAPIRDGDKGFFDHLVLVDTANKRSHPITHGSMDVIKITAWDEERKLIYFLAIPANVPKERRFYRMKVEQPYTEHIPECLSCDENENNLPSQTSHKSHEYKGNGTGSSSGTSGSGSKSTKKKAPVASFSSSSSEGSSRSESFRNKEDHVESHGGESGGKVKGSNGNSSTENSSTLGKRSTTGNGAEESEEEPAIENILFGGNRSCSYVTNVKFSAGKSYFTLECGGPDIPFVVLCSAEPSAPKLVRILQNNDALRNLSNGMAFPQVEIFEVALNSGHSVQVKLLLPPGLRKEDHMKYPLILNVYGGPGTQLATDRWGVDFATYLASKKDYIVLQVDSRGSGGKGWDFQHKVFYKIGLLEAEDQIEIVKDLKNALHFVDGRKIGVWGWSYGGYLTSMILANKDSADLFHCGASVAPVTNWKLYDSAYTERYMGKPNVTENYRGYVESDVTQNVENFENKMFYLLHGTADDNVHIQHSMLLAKALIDKKIMFRQQIYPDEPHSLKGVQYHVHKSLEEFFEDCFKKQAELEMQEALENKYKMSEGVGSE